MKCIYLEFVPNFNKIKHHFHQKFKKSSYALIKRTTTNNILSVSYVQYILFRVNNVAVVDSNRKASFNKAAIMLMHLTFLSLNNVQFFFFKKMSDILLTFFSEYKVFFSLLIFSLLLGNQTKSSSSVLNDSHRYLIAFMF